MTLTKQSTLQDIVIALGHGESEVRAQALDFVQSWVEANSLTFKDQLHLWFGIFKAYFMCDGVGPISEAAVKIARLAPRCGDASHVCALFLILNNEWEKCDQWRLNKLLRLVRIICAELIEVIVSSDFDPEVVLPIMTAILVSSPGLYLPKKAPSSKFPVYYATARAMARPTGPRGVVMHLAECLLDELNQRILARVEKPEIDVSNPRVQFFLGMIICYFCKFIESDIAQDQLTPIILTKVFLRLVQEQDLSVTSQSRPLLIATVHRVLRNICEDDVTYPPQIRQKVEAMVKITETLGGKIKKSNKGFVIPEYIIDAGV
eukprot:Blabericola_migrator_1__4245@NODE_22_length_22262_cov_139_742014_g19_i0_p9_GENE_NODE_22_length_22262_cov_139_742014_g19_i0NODE_22_length_22262_cov_139_742014_g19_i0_p9_ORF_typecomplete_len319_score45_94Nop52/PF05997_12/1_2e25_NODE_22_length_22262_cov_139_742014_g19_i01711618072